MVTLRTMQVQHEPVSLPRVLQLALPMVFPSNTAAKRACRNKGGQYRIVLSDGRAGKCDTQLTAGDSFSIEARTRVALPELKVIWSDADVMVVHKPPGLAMHGDGDRSLTALLQGQKATPCHRLDAPTEGLVICGRTPDATAAIQEQFRCRTVKKVYRAVVHDCARSSTGDIAVCVSGSDGSCGHGDHTSGVVDSPIEGRRAQTSWRVLWRGISSMGYGPLACLHLEPLTGRQHQLRRHLADCLGKPIVGDVRYVPQGVRTVRQAPLLLAALEVEFTHPSSQSRIRVAIDEPSRFRSFGLLPQPPMAGDIEGEVHFLAAVVRAGQKQSPCFKEKWAAFCRANACWEGSPEGGERDARKIPLATLRAFFSIAQHEFAGTAWMPHMALGELTAAVPTEPSHAAPAPGLSAAAMPASVARDQAATGAAAMPRLTWWNWGCEWWNGKPSQGECSAPMLQCGLRSADSPKGSSQRWRYCACVSLPG